MPRRWSPRATPIVALVVGCGSAGSAAVVVEIPLAAVAEPDVPDASAALVGSDASALLGRWVGVGRQASGESWEMVVDLVALGPGVCGRVSYPTIPCAAEWTCAEKPNRATLHAREHVTDGRDNCVDDGEMTMTLTKGGQLAWSWAGSGDTAKALLSRGARPR